MIAHLLLLKSYIDRLSYSLSLLSLLRLVKQEAVDAAKSKLYNYGIFSQAENAEIAFEIFLDSYRGKHRLLSDTVRAIDLYANRVVEKLTTERQYLYLYNSIEKRTIDKYEILR